MNRFVADFETATWKEDETWVWAYAVCEIGKEDNIEIGNNIDDFMKFCYKNKGSKIYFHNLKFDGEFIIYWLLTHDFKCVNSIKELEDKSFTCLINNMGQFYDITVCFKKGNKTIEKVTFIDSLKIIPFPVSLIAKKFNLEESKLEIDYNKSREVGHILTKEEEDYIKNDVVIVSKSLNVLFNKKLDRMTQASNAMHNYKELITINKFNHYFPTLDIEIHEDLKKSYKGGFTYLNPAYKEKEVGEGVVLDVNSLYPSVMYEKNLPYGFPIFYEGKYEDDNIYDLYIQMITCEFRLKKNKIPTIQIKHSLYFNSNEYLTTSNDEIVCLVLTNVDLKLFLEQYDVYNLRYECGWKFKSKVGIFKEYIDKWIEEKNKATIEKNEGNRTLAKLMLNSLYGKFATSVDVESKYPVLDENGIVHYKPYQFTENDTSCKEYILRSRDGTFIKKSKNIKELFNIKNEKDKIMKFKEPIYIPIASFITSYAREKTIRTSQAIKDFSINKYGKDLYYYSDTDSIHTGLSIEELKQFCEIDDVELGKWKHEGTFKRAKFIRQKCYIEDMEKGIKITCAGLPSRCYEYVTWDNFKTGFRCGEKLTFSHVKGGVILKETEFTIVEDKSNQDIINIENRKEKVVNDR